MSEPRNSPSPCTRRALLKHLQYAPVLWLPSPLRSLVNLKSLPTFALGEIQVAPHYRSGSPLDDMLRLVSPGADGYTTEAHAFRIEETLRHWGQALTSGTTNDALPSLFDRSLVAASPLTTTNAEVYNRYGIRASRQTCSADLELGRDNFLDELRKYLHPFTRIAVAEFQVVSIRELASSPLEVEAEILYTFIGEVSARGREQRMGRWRTQWRSADGGPWHAHRWLTLEETISQAGTPIFMDITAQAMGHLPSYREQMLRGIDDWRTVLDGACGMDVYGNQGIAVGDYDNDGCDDIYVCQPAGLPNRLYRNRGDGTFDDVTEASGLELLDATSCAIFADFENRGMQDLLVVTSSGPLLFANDGRGKFSLKADAFKFANPPQGTFTHAAVADHDHDGRLDVYFCLYNYYAGLDQYRYPSPYFDARNGPPNFLFRNIGGWRFEDVTHASGLNVDNNRYSFACAWGDYNDDGWPDLYVANDFGRNNLYRNNGDGTFSSVATEAGVEDVGAGMSVSWLDTNGDGRQDIYVANMWSAAGLRISAQPAFHAADPEPIRTLYRRHADGNSLYQNLGSGKFRNAARDAKVEFGGWAWSSDSWDFDHDGHPDIFITNGYVSGTEPPELSSFFWRQVVGNSPQHLAPAPNYEQAWNAINELMRSGHSWSGYERNVFYANNHDGSFSDISGLSGMDFPDDGRAFALADLDHDGRMEVVLKNRTAPQLRVLRNALEKIGNSVAFRLHGTESNRDAIGAAVTVESVGRRQTKYLQAGSGFLSQHTKEVFFGLGDQSGPVTVTVRWPRGRVGRFPNVPANHRIELSEDSPEFRAQRFSPTAQAYLQPTAPLAAAPLPSPVETWLIQPLPAPAFTLLEISGKSWDLHAISGKKLLVFWSAASTPSHTQLHALADHQDASPNLKILAVNVDDPSAESAVRSFAAGQNLAFPLLMSTSEVTGIYNLIYRYLFDRHRDLSLPTSFLIDGENMIAKVYQGSVNPRRFRTDADMIPLSAAERRKHALPFAGTLFLGNFERNDFTYGVAFFQHGYLDAAADSFRQVIREKPDQAEAYFNLGTLYLRRKDLEQARTYLEKAVELKPDHAEAWNNLGMIAAEAGSSVEAVNDFKQSLGSRPDYVVALLNLGNMYRRQKRFDDAEQLLLRAFVVDPSNPEASYSLGMLYAQQNEIERAQRRFQEALNLRPGYPDALNNFGVLLVREQRYSDAEEKFQQCIRSNPDFDQAYMNLARLYLLLDDKTKARQVLEALLRRQPEHPMAQQALKMLQ